MKHATGRDIDVYRVRQTANHPDRSVRKAWYGRTWQAEWEGCVWAERAYTERGVRRKARRHRDDSMEQRLRLARRRSWWRAHVTRRGDPFYKAQRSGTYPSVTNGTEPA